MKHKKINKNLLLFLEDRLKEAEKEEIEKHLETCSKCQDKLNNLKYLWDVQPIKYQAPADLWFSFYNRISGTKTEKTRLDKIFTHLVRPALLLVLLIASVFIGSKLGENHFLDKNNDNNISSIKEFYLDYEVSSNRLNDLLYFSLEENGGKK